MPHWAAQPMKKRYRHRKQHMATKRGTAKGGRTKRLLL